MTSILTPQALADLLAAAPDTKILDATYGVAQPVPALMEGGRIDHAQFFDIDAVADLQAPYPHTLPPAETFEKKVGALGIGNDDTVVVYDQNGISFAAARAWWMFRTFGHKKIYILNGGLAAWKEAGHPVQTGPLEPPAPKTYQARFNPALYKSFEQMEDGGDTVLDARASPRFLATVHTPDGDSVPAHIHGSMNMPFQDLLDYTGALKPAENLHPILEPYLQAARLTCTCGSGVTACVVALALHALGRDDVAIYDGSWTEWADRQGLR